MQAPCPQIRHQVHCEVRLKSCPAAYFQPGLVGATQYSFADLGSACKALLRQCHPNTPVSAARLLREAGELLGIALQNLLHHKKTNFGAFPSTTQQLGWPLSQAKAD